VLEPAQDVVPPDLGMELHRPRALAYAEALRHRPARKLDRARRDLEGIAVRVERLEAAGQRAEHGIGGAGVGELGLVEAAELPLDRSHVRAERVCQRLRPETDREHRCPVVDPATQRLVLLVQPRVLGLLTDVLVAAEHHYRVDVLRRRAVRAHVPEQELVAVLGEHLLEELRTCVRAVNDCEHAHRHAVGTFSSSSSLRNRSAPAGACATPFVWLLLLKYAYASSDWLESSRRGGTHSRSSRSSYR